MNKVLVIAHLNLSYGSFRPVPLATHLPEFGWEPILLTPRNYMKPVYPFPFRVVDTDYRDIPFIAMIKRLFGFKSVETLSNEMKTRLGIKGKKSLTAFMLKLGAELLAYPDLSKKWEPFATAKSEEIIQTDQIKAIISCMPVTSYIVANKLRTRYKLPWIADLTDLWSQNHDYQYSPIRRMFDRRLERKTLSKADALVTVSEPWAEKLRTLHKRKSVYAITHGFDPEMVNVPPAGLAPRFTITYTGTIYTGKQDPTRLFAALQELVEDGTIDPAKIEVRFYGASTNWLEGEIERYGLSDVVKVYNAVPKEAAVARQRESHVLLLLKWEDPAERGVHTGKLFEYLAARRPIMATGGSHDVVTDLLEETGAGLDAPDTSSIKNVLTMWYREYVQTGTVKYCGDPAKIEKYSQRQMAHQFAVLLDSLTSQPA